MHVPQGDQVHFDVVTHHPTSQVVWDADAAPTFDVMEEDTDTPVLDNQAMTRRVASGTGTDDSFWGVYRGSFAASSGNGFEAGKWYTVVVTATVAGVTGRCVAMHFRVATAESVVGRPVVDVGSWKGATPNDLVSGRIDASVGAMTAAALADFFDTDTGQTHSTAVTGSVVGELLIAEGGAGTGTGGAGGSSLTAQEVWEYATRTLTALDEDSTTLDLDATVRAAVGLAAANLDTQLTAIDDFLDTEVAAIKAVTDKLDVMLESDPTGTGGVWRFTVNAVEGVWDVDMALHLESGTTGAALNAAGSAGDPWGTALPGAYGAGTAGNILGNRLDAAVSTRASQSSVDTVDDFLDTEVAAIKAVTDQFVFTTANRVDAQVFGMQANTLTASALAADAVTEVQAGLSTLDAAGVRSAVGLAAANLDTQLTAIDDFLDTEVAAILAAVDTEVAAIKAKTDNLPASPAATGDAMTLTAGERSALVAALLATALADSPTDGTVAAALLAAEAQGVGKWVLDTGALTLTVYRRNGTTVVRTFALNSAVSPTSRT